MLYLASSLCYPEGRPLVPEDVAPSAAPVDPSVGVDQQRVGAGAGDEDEAAGVGGHGERADRVAGDVVVVGQVGVVPGQAGHKQSVGLLPLATAQAQTKTWAQNS